MSFLGRPSAGDSPFAIGDRAMRDTSSPKPPSQRNPAPRQPFQPQYGSMAAPSPYGSVSDEARRRYEERYARIAAEKEQKEQQKRAEEEAAQRMSQMNLRQDQQQLQWGSQPQQSARPPSMSPRPPQTPQSPHPQQMQQQQQRPPYSPQPQGYAPAASPSAHQQQLQYGHPQQQQAYARPPPRGESMGPPRGDSRQSYVQQQQRGPSPAQTSQAQQYAQQAQAQRGPSPQQYRPPHQPQAQQPGYAAQQQQQQYQDPRQPSPSQQQHRYSGQQYGAAPSYSPPASQQTHQQTPPPAAPVAPAVEVNDLRILFSQFDSTRSGQLSAYDLRKLLEKDASMVAREDCVKMLMNIFDTDRSGSINFTEFEGLYRYIQDWHGIFARFDQDNSGLIDRQELHAALQGFGMPLSQDMVRKLEKRYAPPPVAGENSSGGISFDRFLMACVTVKHYTEKFRENEPQGGGFTTMDYKTFMDMVLDAP